MTTGGASFPVSGVNKFESGKQSAFGGYRGNNASFGLSFRNAIDFDVSVGGSTWRTNAADTQAFSVHFACDIGNNDVMDPWGLYARNFPYNSSILATRTNNGKILDYTIDRTKDPDNSM